VELSPKRERAFRHQGRFEIRSILDRTIRRATRAGRGHAPARGATEPPIPYENLLHLARSGLCGGGSRAAVGPGDAS